MQPGNEQRVVFVSSLEQVSAQSWDAVCGSDYPFMRHAFLLGLEHTQCTTASSGWQPCHALLYEGDRLQALLPLYLKSHSYGEYVFDWAWADAWQRSGLQYYPKLLSAIPFTPATGPRLCCASGLDPQQVWPVMLEAIRQLAGERGLSSLHILFPDGVHSSQLESLGLTQRLGVQFHWHNDSYGTFDDFLARFSSRKRKNLRRERQRVAEQGISLQRLRGAQISPELWERFHYFYQLTYAKRSGHGGYLSREFFTESGPAMGESVMMVVAQQQQRPVAAALYFCSADTLYGRYWGCEQEFDMLHFEACYYQGIEFCIEQGIERFDPGAQGEHKIQRGFEPVFTYSNHWLATPQLREPVADFCRREALEMQRYREDSATLLPFKQA